MAKFTVGIFDPRSIQVLNLTLGSIFSKQRLTRLWAVVKRKFGSVHNFLDRSMETGVEAAGREAESWQGSSTWPRRRGFPAAPPPTCSTIPTWCAPSCASGSRPRRGSSAISVRIRRAGCSATASSTRSRSCRRAAGGSRSRSATRSTARFSWGSARSATRSGANLVVIPDRPDNHGIKNALVDGFIFGRAGHLSEIEPARLRRLPFAVVDFDPGPNISSVRVDARAGAYAAAKHLTGLGHRRFGIVSFMRSSTPARLHPAGVPRPPEAAGMPTDQEKYRGYAEALAEAGIEIADIPDGPGRSMGRRTPPRMILDAAPDATAILSMGVQQGISVVERGAPAREVGPARSFRRRLQRHPGRHALRPAAHHRRRHVHPEGARRGPAWSLPADRRATRSSRRSSSCAARPGRRPRAEN